MRFGLLLPHFGPQSTYDRLFGLGSRLDDLGFASVWVRDQLGFTGGVSFESRSHHFVDPFITLSAIAANTGLTVGTATLTPIRQPVVLAQLVGSLAYLAQGRLVLGVGLGGQPRAFALAGHSIDDRLRLFRETIDVLRATAHPKASYHGRFAHFDDLSLDPAPPADLELWYCGSSYAAIQRAVDHTNGWFPGRCPLSVFDRLHSRLTDLADERGATMHIGIVPLVSIDRDRETALSKVNVAGLLDESNGKPAWHPDGPFERADDLRSALIAGRADDVIEDLAALQARGVDEVVLDLRERMDAFEDTLEQLSAEVFPAFAAKSPA